MAGAGGDFLQPQVCVRVAARRGADGWMRGSGLWCRLRFGGLRFNCLRGSRLGGNGLSRNRWSRGFYGFLFLLQPTAVTMKAARSMIIVFFTMTLLLI